MAHLFLRQERTWRGACVERPFTSICQRECHFCDFVKPSKSLRNILDVNLECV